MMDRSSASDYVYAQASGKLAKSFIGKRAQLLFEARSLQDLWLLVFKTAAPLIPESLLAQELEKQAESNFICDFMSLMGKFSKPLPIFLALLRIHDFSNIKKIHFALKNSQSVLPVLTSIGKYSMLHYKEWPVLEKITHGTSLSWVTELVSGAEVKEFERKLDQQYIHELWNALEKMPASQRTVPEKLIKEEIVFENIIWAVRLKLYYKMSDEEIIPRLACAGVKPKKGDILAGAAIRVLERAIDSYADWENWEYRFLLNPHEEGSLWTVDPRWMQKAANVYLNNLAIKLFHQQQDFSSLVAWFKIKQHELDFIRTAAEGLRLNVEPQKLRAFSGTN